MSSTAVRRRTVRRMGWEQCPVCGRKEEAGGMVVHPTYRLGTDGVSEFLVRNDCTCRCGAAWVTVNSAAEEQTCV